jgi:hypothetical protein
MSRRTYQLFWSANPLNLSQSLNTEIHDDLYKDMCDISSLGVSEDLILKGFSSNFPQSDNISEMGQPLPSSLH